VLVAVTAPAEAGETETFGVAPHPPRVDGTERRAFGIPMQEGRTFTDGVRVYNKTSEPLTLSVYAAEATVGDDGVVSVGFRGSATRGLAAGIDLHTETVELGPRADTVLTFRVRVASDRPSSDLAAIVVESGTERGSGGLDLVQRVAVLVRPAAAGAATGAVPQPEDSRAWWPFVAAAVLLMVAAVLLRRRAVRRRAVRRAAVPVRPEREPSIPVLVAAVAAPQVEPAPPPDPEPTIELTTRAPARRKVTATPRPKKLNYIPLDEL
jgi:hypothetical protein